MARDADQIDGKLLDALAAAGRRLYEGGLAGGTLGSVGVRLPGGKVLVTSGHSRLGFLGPSDLVMLNGRGPVTPEGQVPSRDSGILYAVLTARPEAGAVLRLYPPYSTAFAHKGREFLEKSTKLFTHLQGVAFVPYYRPGTAGLAGAVAEALRSNQVAVVESQGPVIWGSDLEDAVDRAEAFEAACKVAFILGSERPNP